MKLDFMDILKIATAVPAIVKSVQEAFGHKSGAERKAAAMDAATQIVAVTNGVTKKEVLDDAGVQALLSEAIEIGVQQMKLTARMKEIEALVAKAKGDGTVQP